MLSIPFCPYHFVQYHFVWSPVHQLQMVCNMHNGGQAKSYIWQNSSSTVTYHQTTSFGIKVRPIGVCERLLQLKHVDTSTTIAVDRQEPLVDLRINSRRGTCCWTTTSTPACSSKQRSITQVITQDNNTQLRSNNINNIVITYFSHMKHMLFLSDR